MYNSYSMGDSTFIYLRGLIQRVCHKDPESLEIWLLWLMHYLEEQFIGSIICVQLHEHYIWISAFQMATIAPHNTITEYTINFHHSESNNIMKARILQITMTPDIKPCDIMKFVSIPVYQVVSYIIPYDANCLQIVCYDYDQCVLYFPGILPCL